jgi:hypothetical protein
MYVDGYKLSYDIFDISYYCVRHDEYVCFMSSLMDAPGPSRNASCCKNVQMPINHPFYIQNSLVAFGTALAWIGGANELSLTFDVASCVRV